MLSDHRKSLTELQKYQDRMNMLDKLLRQSYEDRLNDIISVPTFKLLADNYEQERKDNQQKIWDLENRIRSFRSNEGDVSKWVSLIKGCTQIETLDSQLLLSLIECIVVSEVRTDAGKPAKSVKIIYKYVGNLSWLV